MKSLSMSPWWLRLCALLIVGGLLSASTGALPVSSRLSTRAIDSVPVRGDVPSPTVDERRAIDRADTPYPHSIQNALEEIRQSTATPLPPSTSRSTRISAWLKKQHAGLKVNAAQLRKSATFPIRKSFSRIKTGLTRSRKKEEATVNAEAQGIVRQSQVELPQPERLFAQGPGSVPIHSVPRQALLAREWLPDWAKKAYNPSASHAYTPFVGEALKHGGESQLLSSQESKSIHGFFQESKFPVTHAIMPDRSESFHSASEGLLSSPESVSDSRIRKVDKNPLDIGEYTHGSMLASLEKDIERSDSSSPPHYVDLHKTSTDYSSSEESLIGQKRRPGALETMLPHESPGHLLLKDGSPSTNKDNEQLATVQRAYRSFKPKVLDASLKKVVTTAAENIRSVPHLVRRVETVKWQGNYPGEYIRVHLFQPRGGRPVYHFVHENAVGAASSSKPWSSLSRAFKNTVLQAIPNARRLGRGEGTPQSLGIQTTDAFTIGGPKYAYPNREPQYIEVIERNGDHIIRRYSDRSRQYLGEWVYSDAPEHITNWLYQQDSRIGHILFRRDTVKALPFEELERDRIPDNGKMLHKRDPHVVWQEHYSGEFISIRKEVASGRYIFQFEPAANMYRPVRVNEWGQLTKDEQSLIVLAVHRVEELVDGTKTAQQLGIRLTDSFAYYDNKGYIYPGRGPRYLTALDYGSGSIVFEQRASQSAAPFRTSPYAQLPEFIQEYVSVRKPELTSVLRPPSRSSQRGVRSTPFEQGSSSSAPTQDSRQPERLSPATSSTVPHVRGATNYIGTGESIEYPGEKIRIFQVSNSQFRISHELADTSAPNAIHALPSYHKIEGSLKIAVNTAAPGLRKATNGDVSALRTLRIAKTPNDAVNAYDYPRRGPETIRLVEQNGRAAFLRTDRYSKEPIGMIKTLTKPPRLPTFSELPDHIRSYLLAEHPMFLEASKEIRPLP